MVSMNNRIQIDQPAPDFALTDLHDQKVRLTDFNNKSNVLLVFNRGFV
jgi:peroxiredoxin